MKARMFLAALPALAFAAAANAQLNSFVEGFDAGIPTGSNATATNIVLPSGTWVAHNRSSSIGTTGVFQGNPTVFPPYEGAGYMGMNFNSTTGVNTISTWMMSPVLNLANGGVFSFWTRGATGNWPDRLELRLSTAGSSIDTGAPGTGVGDFSTLLLSVNPNLQVGGYPTAWTEYTVTLSDLAGPATGRIAFRYFVTNGGPSGANSNYIGIDYASYVVPAPGVLALLGLAGCLGRRSRRRD
jgi:hypothetical protein